MGNRGHRITVCTRCQNLKRHEAHGLCKCCYNRVREGRAGNETLTMYRDGTIHTRDRYDSITGQRKVGLVDPISKLAAGRGGNLVVGRRITDAPHCMSHAEQIAQQINNAHRRTQ